MLEEIDGVLVAAHELKAPLAVLRQLALSFDDLDTQNEHVRAEMVNVSERALKQVNDLVKLRRLKDGMFEMEPVAVRAVCDEVTNEINHLFNSNRRELFVKYTNRSRLVTANRELLHSVVYNFLINAMHYSDEGTKTEKGLGRKTTFDCNATGFFGVRFIYCFKVFSLYECFGGSNTTS